MRSGRPLHTELYVVVFANVADAVFPGPVVRAERAYKRKLVRLGHLVMGGPWADQSGGLAILRADSEASVKQLIEAEPFVANGLQTYQLRPWNLVHGDLVLRDEVISSRLFAAGFAFPYPSPIPEAATSFDDEVVA